jgi:Mce-associated membrane protein
MKNGILIELHSDKEVAVPSFRRRASVLDADRAPEPVEERTPPPDAAADALALAEEAEAEAAEAEAIAAAARAKARAIRLRREAAAAASATAAASNGTAASAVVDAPAVAESAEPEPAEPAGTVAADADEAPTTERAHSRRIRLARPKWSRVAIALLSLLSLVALAVSAVMIFSHRQHVAEEQQRAEYAAAARQSVVTLMSLDFNKAEEDVKRIIDNSTGQFREEFEAQAQAFAQVAQQSKVVTEVTVNSAAVKQMTDDTAVVLVSATSRVTNATGARQDPRSWRLAVDLERDGDQIKMARVEFVP